MSLVYTNTREEFEREVLNSELPVIVDFWAEWCGPCQMMAPVFEKFSVEYEGKLNFVKLNTETPDNQQISMEYGIRGIPSLLIFKGGKEVGRIVGFAPEPILKAKIENILATI